MTPVKIGIIGDFDDKKPSHHATVEALSHCAEYQSMTLSLDWLPTASLEDGINHRLSEYNALFCAPGAYQSTVGAINAICYAREHDVPLIGTCGGFQHMVMEFALNVLGMPEVFHEEYNPQANTFVIKALSCSLAGQTASIHLKKGSICQAIYNQDCIDEQFNCHYGINPDLLEAFEQNGFFITGRDRNGEVRILEMPDKHFYVATLFQPQLSSTSEQPHPLLVQYLLSAQDN